MIWGRTLPCRPNTEILDWGTLDSLGCIIICWGTVLCITVCLAASLGTPPSHGSQRCIRTGPDAPWGQNHRWLRTADLLHSVSWLFSSLLSETPQYFNPAVCSWALRLSPVFWYYKPWCREHLVLLNTFIIASSSFKSFFIMPNVKCQR